MKTNTILLEGKLDLTNRKQSYPPTGTHPSPRSVSVWCSTSSSGSLSSTNKLTLCIHWSLTEDIAIHPWVVTRGRNYLVIMPLYSSIVIWKGSTQYVTIVKNPQGLASWQITKMNAIRVIPGSDLVQKEKLITPVETWLSTRRIMETKTSKPWVTYWFSEWSLDEWSDLPYNDVAVVRTFFFHLNPIYTSKTRLVKAVSLKETQGKKPWKTTFFIALRCHQLVFSMP